MVRDTTTANAVASWLARFVASHTLTSFVRMLYAVLLHNIRTLGCGDGSPGVYSRVSDAFEWIRFAVCQNSVAPPLYLNCATSIDPQIGPDDPAPLTPQSPIGFKFEVGADGYFYENGK